MVASGWVHKLIKGLNDVSSHQYLIVGLLETWISLDAVYRFILVPGCFSCSSEFCHTDLIQSSRNV